MAPWAAGRGGRHGAGRDRSGAWLRNATIGLCLLAGAAAAVAAILGAIVGSFLNVVAYRLPRGESLAHPPSACPSCGTPIKPYDNVPVLGWLWLRGKCRACQAPISPRYPIVEAVTGLLCAACVLEFGADMPANVKETQFFTTYYHKGIDWYAWHFRHARGDRPVGEVCPYFNPPQARARIKLHVPDCKIICTLRDPVDRIYSHYKMLRRNVWTRGTFLNDVETRPRMQSGNRYATHLADWFEKFGRDRVLVLFYEELRNDRQG